VEKLLLRIITSKAADTTDSHAMEQFTNSITNVLNSTAKVTNSAANGTELKCNCKCDEFNNKNLYDNKQQLLTTTSHSKNGPVIIANS